MEYLVALEGIDGSGKGTQAKKLYDRFVAAGKKTSLISFPRYDDTLFGRAIGQFLNGRFGSLGEVNPFLVSLLYAGDRFESRKFLLDALAANDVVVLDRYVPSNIAHQGAKLSGNERREIVEWITTIEHGIYQLPQADLVILLDLPAVEARKLIAKKSARTYTDREADLQESDTTYLEQVRQVYREQAAAHANWRMIECFDGRAIRSMDEIGEVIWQAAGLIR
ncbi:MAG: dTMP kinase [Planctomycetaceae bacterium]